MGDAQKELDDILLHTLGLTRGEEMYRNRFVASPGHHDWYKLMELERLGLMVRILFSSILAGGGLLFCATDAGKQRARAAKAAAGPPLWRVSYSRAGLLECDDIRGACEWSTLIRAKSRSAAKYQAALNGDTDDGIGERLQWYRAVREYEPIGVTP